MPPPLIKFRKWLVLWFLLFRGLSILPVDLAGNIQELLIFAERKIGGGQSVNFAPEWLLNVDANCQFWNWPFFRYKLKLTVIISSFQKSHRSSIRTLGINFKLSFDPRPAKNVLIFIFYKIIHKFKFFVNCVFILFFSEVILFAVKIKLF